MRAKENAARFTLIPIARVFDNEYMTKMCAGYYNFVECENIV